MKYHNGQEAKIGDKVRLGQDRDGVVVASFDTGEYSAGYRKAEWAYLGQGVMINFPMYGLIHYEKPEIDLELIERAST